MIYPVTKMTRNVAAVHTHTLNLVNKIINIEKKGDISLLCVYYDTG